MNRQQRRASQANGAAQVRKGWNDFENVTEDAKLLRSWNVMPTKPLQVFKNNLYVVQVFAPTEGPWGDVRQVGIRRNDEAASHSWQHFQQIKNCLFGPEWVAVEVYPPVSQLVDVANMYWLWVMPPGSYFPNMKGQK